MRAFVAAGVSCPGALEAIARLQASLRIDARPVPAGSLHFTLAFLGEVGEAAARDAAAALGGVRFGPFTVRLGGVGAFPGPRRPRVVWAGTDAEGGRRLSALAAAVRGALRPLGLAGGGRFVPHVTVLRVKSGAGAAAELAAHAGDGLGTERVDRIALKRSDPGPGGPAYSDVAVVHAS